MTHGKIIGCVLASALALAACNSLFTTVQSAIDTACAAYNSVKDRTNVSAPLPPKVMESIQVIIGYTDGVCKGGPNGGPVEIDKNTVAWVLSNSQNILKLLGLG